MGAEDCGPGNEWLAWLLDKTLVNCKLGPEGASAVDSSKRE